MKRLILSVLIFLCAIVSSHAAVIYLRSVDGSDADNGSTWALAKATMQAAMTAAGAGGTVYMSDNHAETGASALTLTCPGTQASPQNILCVDDAAGPPTALATTGTVSTTGASTIKFVGCAYLYGITFSAGSSSNAAGFYIYDNSGVAHYVIADNCNFIVNNTSAGSGMIFGGDIPGYLPGVELVDCNLTFGAVGQFCTIRSFFNMRGGSILGTAPTILFKTYTPSSAALIFGVDLSLLGSGKTLFAPYADALANTSTGVFQFENCKLGSSVVVSTVPAVGRNRVVRLVNCDSADTNYRYALYNFQGSINQETTIVMTGGATDGVTPISRKMVSSANSKFYSPLESDPIVFWNESTASLTATVEIVTDNVTLTDAEAWLQVEELGTSSFPKSVFVSDRAANILTTPANQDSSSVTWTTTGLTTPIKQKLSVTFTPTGKGPIKARVMLAKASTTMYYNEQTGQNSGRAYQHGAMYMNEPTAGAGGVSRASVVNGGR